MRNIPLVAIQEAAAIIIRQVIAKRGDRLCTCARRPDFQIGGGVVGDDRVLDYGRGQRRSPEGPTLLLRQHE